MAFGFDHLGRDLFSRVLHGSRMAQLVGVVSSAISVVIGVTLTPSTRTTDAELTEWSRV